MLVFKRMRSLVGLMLAMAMTLAAGLSFAVPAHASDLSGPVLLNPKATPTNLNFHNGPATINITLRLVDATGVEAPVMLASWVNPDPWSWGSGQSQGFGRMTLVSGNMKDGIWKHTISIPQGAATGQWEMTLYPLSDTWGNRSSFFQTLATVTVIDEAPPTVVSPASVTFTDSLGTKNDKYTIPTTTGVQYLVGGKALSAGTYPGTGKITVTAVARTGYVLEPKAPSAWTQTFKGLLVGSAPTISGTAQVGSTLTAKTGTWTPSPVALGYQWYRSGVAIAGAVSGTYVVAAADAGNTITLNVTGSKAGYSPVTKKSAPTAQVTKGSFSGRTVSIDGTSRVAQTLTANVGAWIPTPASFKYQWYRYGAPIVGANASTYTLTAADAAATLTVKVTGSKSGYSTASTTSAPTAAVAKGSLARSTPTITGKSAVGSVLTANPGVWGPAPVTLKYQWYRAGALVSGANAATYTPTTADLGAVFTVKVTGSKAGFATFSRTSAPTAAVVKGSLVRATPVITGTAKVGATLTADPGAWGPAPVTLRYQWYRSGSAITGATTATYSPTKSDAAKTLTVKVTASKSGFTTFARTSAPTAIVAK